MPLREVINQDLVISEGSQWDSIENYREMFDSYYVSLCRYAFRFVGSESIAEDIVSDLFVKMWENRDVIIIKGSVKSYLFQATHNRSLNYIEKVKREVSIEETLYANGGEQLLDLLVNETTYDSILMQELGEAIEAAIDRLTPKQKEVFTLKRVEGKSNKEISDILSISVKTVEMHSANAALSLKNNLKEYLSIIMLLVYQSME